MHQANMFSEMLHCNVGVVTHHFRIVLTSSSASASKYSSRRSTLMALTSSSLFHSFLLGCSKSISLRFSPSSGSGSMAASCATATSIWPPCTCALMTGGLACAVRAACTQLWGNLLEVCAAVMINDC